MSRLALGLTVLIASACSSLPAELEPFDGTFEYVALNQNGAQVLAGQLVLDVRDNGNVTGSWEIDWVEGADRQTPVGPQVGKGSLVGSIASGQLTLDLNPQNADNDVGLLGTLDGTRIAGSWEYVSFAGKVGSGPFRAKRQ